MSEFIKLVATSEVPQGAMKEVESEGHPLLVARVGGTFLVADARCPHLGGHLAEGVLVGAVVTCPRHHSQFDLTDGRVVRWTDFTGPLEQVNETIRHHRPLQMYEVRVADGVVSVGPPKAAAGA